MDVSSWRQSISRHTDEDPAPISFLPSVRYLQDEEYCRTLHEDFKRYGSHWERRRATADLWQMLPQNSGLYMFVWVRDRLLGNITNHNNFHLNWCLYVGKAGAGSNNTLQSRYKQEYRKYLEARDPEIFWSERRDVNRQDRLQKVLSLEPIEYWFVEIEDQSKITNLENRLIKLLNPPGNVNGRATLKPQASRPAFRTY
jgi:hypothetical protein